MSPLLQALIGPLVEGAVDLFTDQAAAKENLKSGTTKVGAGVAATTTTIVLNTDQSAEQLLIGFIGYAVSLGLVLWKSRKTK